MAFGKVLKILYVGFRAIFFKMLEEQSVTTGGPDAENNYYVTLCFW